MSCIDRKELEQFLKGKLEPERLLAVDEHISRCAACRAGLLSLPRLQTAGMDMGAALLGVEDCPDYEELSAYVDKALGIEQAKAVELHANMCELCTRDIAHISELRSHAAMRQKAAVRRGMSRRTEWNALIIWKRALAGLAGTAALAAIAFTISHQPAQISQVAENKPGRKIERTDKERTIKMAKDSEKTTPKIESTPAPGTNAKDNTSSPKPLIDQPKPKPAVPAPPTYVALLKDGSYSVVRQNGKVEFARGGAIVRDELEAELEAAIQQKLRNGTMKPAKSVQMAMADLNTRTRAENGTYNAPPTAPDQVSPVGKKIILDATPSFAWKRVDLAVAYRLQVFANGKQVVDETTDNNSFTLETPLPRGQVYMWRVSAKFSRDGSWSDSGARVFQVLSDTGYDAIQRVKEQMPSSHLALGTVYEYYGLKDEARAEYQLLQRSNPGSNLPKRLLKGIGEAEN